MKNISKWFFYTVSGIVIFSFFIVILATSHKESSSDTVVETKAEPEPEKKICDTAKAKEYFDAMFNEATIFTRISEPSLLLGKLKIYRITADDSWYRFSFVEKQGIDALVRCHLSDGYKSKLPWVVYLDRDTGKRIAGSDVEFFDN